ncbi:flagellar protein FlaG [Selenomonas ruminantium]|uniref:Flagellar protein FlaG n=1 Tax=Selenomonas ruminantium TaxID=971 RepID=A0A1M6UML1_SELRU|nr:flagellar protein FlaG [Selenomonas ruminantium]SHK70411.1 flagellar protein FlaG [Selenomonas ruminantium]
MVGKIQDIVSASIVAGAAERVGGDASSRRMNEGPETDSVQNARDIQNTSRYDRYSEKEDEDIQKAQDEDREPMDEKAVSYMMQELNELMSKINCNLEFQYHKEVNLMTVRMLDKKTHEVLKEVPPEEMLDQMAKAREWLGAFLDKNA